MQCLFSHLADYFIRDCLTFYTSTRSFGMVGNGREWQENLAIVLVHSL